jgi:NADH-quinone oxidoreductase subunit E
MSEWIPEHLTLPTDELTADERWALIASMRPDDAEGVPELAEVDVPPDLREEIETVMSRYPQLRSTSIPALWAVQRHYGWCSPEGLRQAAAVMGVTPAFLESVASFYDMLYTHPVGRHKVFVCRNLSCWMNGGDELLSAFCEAAGVDAAEAGHGASSEDGEFFITGFECLGACDIAPMAFIDERYYGPLDAGDALAAIEQIRSGAALLPGKEIVARPAAGGPEPEPDPRVVEVAEDRAPGRGAEEAPR